MKDFLHVKYGVFAFFLLCFTCQVGVAQKHAIFNNDLDGDGIADTGGQDKCPTTLEKIKGRKATTMDEVSGTEIIIQLPDKLKEYIFQDRTPLEAQQKKLRNEQATHKRERRRVDEKYGKYKDMKGKERKAKIEKLDSIIAGYDKGIANLQEKIRNVDPDSYISFAGSILDREGNVLKQKATVKIRLRVDAFGCLKDDDKDGSPNMVDLCPGDVGTMESNGCPDRDNDGIPDRKDDCPDVPGEKATNGCPDKDKDGVPDIKDDCPDTKGVIELKGCPDKDKDGVPDKEDKCPDVKGLKIFEGCPDRDKDGIPDKEDKCPDLAGQKEHQGCPDRDNDGVLDPDDDCPDVPGPEENKGCPKILEKASKVLFESGKAIIKPVSFSLLDELVNLLKEYPDSYIMLEGHTDSQGGEDANLQLSKDRAKSVKSYLVKKGIAQDRIASTGHGEMKPIGSNETAAGRTKNRRVDMKLSNKKEDLIKFKQQNQE